VSDDFTIAFWMQSTKIGPSQPDWASGLGLVDGNVPGAGGDFGISVRGRGIAFGVGHPGTTVTSERWVIDGTWHHIAATRERATGRLSLFIDGVEEGEAEGPRLALDAPPKLMIGCSLRGGSFYQGSIDDLRIYARALSGDEVRALVRSGQPPAQVTSTTGSSAAPGGEPGSTAGDSASTGAARASRYLWW
jgi:hypothetical protein